MRRIRTAERRGDYAAACALLIRRDARRATAWHYRHVWGILAWMPAVAVWTYLLTQIIR